MQSKPPEPHLSGDNAFASASVARVHQFLLQAGQQELPRILPDAAHTAQQAADALGVALGQIAKSIIFAHAESGKSVLIVSAGDRRVDTHKVSALLGPLRRADAEFVKTQTGYSIGGVSPLAHANAPYCLLDQSLTRFATVWAAAGHPRAVFPIAPLRLAELCGAPLADVTENPDHAPPAFGMGLATPSPCIDVCTMDSGSGHCQGCYRSLDEIAAWSTLDDSKKQHIWRQCLERRGLRATAANRLK